eukprot:UN29874
MKLGLLLLLLLPIVYSQSGTVWYNFPKFLIAPSTETDALNNNLMLFNECPDFHGRIYTDITEEFLPAFFYDEQGELFGLIFAVDVSLLANEEEYSPWSCNHLRGQIYYFKNPDNLNEYGIWTVLDGMLFQVPNNVQNLLNMGTDTSDGWTEHLCLTGMGTHQIYGPCGSN